ncbi:MAG: hypothetical protein LKE52_01850 [Bacilli bacterium]|nr:hypothetical protein [Bacilli bacterium]
MPEEVKKAPAVEAAKEEVKAEAKEEAKKTLRKKLKKKPRRKSRPLKWLLRRTKSRSSVNPSLL